MPKFYFVTDEEVPVPDDFPSFSGFLADYEGAMVTSESEETNDAYRRVPLTIPGARLRTIFDFFDTFRQADPVEYAKQKEAKSANEDISAVPAWASQFFGNLNKDDLLHVMNAAGFLCVRIFLEYSTTYMASKLGGMQLDEVRKLLNLEDDFAQDEWAKLTKENAYSELFKNSS
ncbi:putative negative regulator sulfur controller-3 [Aphelenchoides avenae]|nr:putative negative regulator sulfur controller-3 [Aphelenchus avenae]